MEIGRNIREFCKEWIPLAIQELLRPYLGRSVFFRGCFNNWGSACKYSIGYDHELILEKVKGAMLKVQSGGAAYERDSVLFDSIQHSFPVLAALARAALESGGRLAVLDFGGALGSSYYQCRKFLSISKSLRWGVVEQAHFVKCGKESFESDHLQFFETISACNMKIQPNVALLSSVLQYLPKPFDVLDQLINQKIKYIVLDRTPFSQLSHDFITVQYVPPRIYKASYPCWVFSQEAMLAYLEKEYDTLVVFQSLDGPAWTGEYGFAFGGMILRRRD